MTVTASEEMLGRVAARLSWLDPPPVFLGGATIGLYLDELGRSQTRPTDDVDCIVPAVRTWAKWTRVEEELRANGWSPDPDGPLCRYVSPDGDRVDLMPSDPTVLGFSGRWYAAAADQAVAFELTSGTSILVPPIELLLACKLEAWSDRGRDDPMLSQDLEDIVALLDGCRADLPEAVRRAARDLREWIGSALAEILDSDELREAAISQLPRGGASAERERMLLATMNRLADRTRT